MTGENGATSIPDVWLKFDDNSQAFQECKYASDIDEASSKKDERAIKQVSLQVTWCQTHGFKHILRTEKEIRANPILLDNYRDMHAYIRNHLHPVETDLRIVDGQITPTGSSLRQLQQILSDLSKTAISEAVVWLIALGRVRSNVDRVPFGPKTEVWKR